MPLTATVALESSPQDKETSCHRLLKGPSEFPIDADTEQNSRRAQRARLLNLRLRVKCTFNRCFDPEGKWLQKKPTFQFSFAPNQASLCFYLEAGISALRGLHPPWSQNSTPCGAIAKPRRSPQTPPSTPGWHRPSRTTLVTLLFAHGFLCTDVRIFSCRDPTDTGQSAEVTVFRVSGHGDQSYTLPCSQSLWEAPPCNHCHSEEGLRPAQGSRKKCPLRQWWEGRKTSGSSVGSILTNSKSIGQTTTVKTAPRIRAST